MWSTDSFEKSQGDNLASMKYDTPSAYPSSVIHAYHRSTDGSVPVPAPVATLRVPCTVHYSGYTLSSPCTLYKGDRLPPRVIARVIYSGNTLPLHTYAIRRIQTCL